MITQIIFFLALVLFLILLVRRARSSPEFLQRTGSFIARFGHGVSRAGTQMGGQIIEGAKKVRSNIPLMSEKDHSKPSFNAEHAFWTEEVFEDKPELPGLFEEADEQFRKGNHAQAEELFLKAATKSPNDARIYARLGLLYLNQKNYVDAIEALKVAVKLDKYNPSRRFNLALAYHGNKDNQRAIAAVREAISLDPVTQKYRQFLEQLLENK